MCGGREPSRASRRSSASAGMADAHCRGAVAGSAPCGGRVRNHPRRSCRGINPIFVFESVVAVAVDVLQIALPARRGEPAAGDGARCHGTLMPAGSERSTRASPAWREPEPHRRDRFDLPAIGALDPSPPGRGPDLYPGRGRRGRSGSRPAVRDAIWLRRSAGASGDWAGHFRFSIRCRGRKPDRARKRGPLPSVHLQRRGASTPWAGCSSAPEHGVACGPRRWPTGMLQR